MITGSPDPTLPLVLKEVRTSKYRARFENKSNCTCRYKISHIFVETSATHKFSAKRPHVVGSLLPQEISVKPNIENLRFQAKYSFRIPHWLILQWLVPLWLIPLWLIPHQLIPHWLIAYTTLVYTTLA
jgi:hypothetical protein